MSGVTSSWSRRRAAVAAEAAEQEAAEQEALIQAEQAALAEKTDAEILEELGLPDPDTLVMGDDFKAFMVKTVPAHLRKRALRRLWRSNPVLACVDGLNDYDDDYLTGSTGQGVIKTSYQVGKGMLAHILDVERKKIAAETALANPAPEVVPEADIADEVDPVQAEPEDTQDDVAESSPQNLPPRRMQFQFEDQST